MKSRLQYELYLASKKEKAQEQVQKYLDRYIAGETIQQISNTENITRARVQQILSRNFDGKWKEIVASARKERKVKFPYTVEKTCKRCAKQFTLVVTSHSSNRSSYCSKVCAYPVINVYPDWVKGRGISKENFTPDEWKVINNIRTKSYYRRNHEKSLARSRKNYKKNADLHYIYHKRHAERLRYGYAITPIPNIQRPSVVKP